MSEARAKWLLARARAHHKGGETGAAIAALKKAARLKPFEARLQVRLGNLHLKNRFDAPDLLAETEAGVACLRRAVAISPEDLKANVSLASALIALADAHSLSLRDEDADGALQEAIAAYRTARALDPHDPALATKLADALVWNGQWDGAYVWYQRSLHVQPSGEAWYGLGRLIACMGRAAESVDCYDRALALGGHLRSAAEKTVSLLLLGRIEEAWANHRQHFERIRSKRLDVPTTTPTWHGSDLAGKRIVVYPEGGIGDEVRFMTCYADLIAAAGDCHVLCEPRLQRLVRRSFPQATVHPAPRKFPRKLRGHQTNGLPADFWEELPRFDYHCSAELLPARLRRSFAAFRRDQASCLVADPERQAIWAERLDRLGPGLRVGLCWRSGVSDLSRRVEYTRLHEWLPVLRLPGTRFVNLHYDGNEEIESLGARMRATVHRWPDLDLRDDLDDVAALITQLDLVISAATLTAELAGALGVPTWRVINTKAPSNLWRVFPGTKQDVWHPSMTQMNGEPIGDTNALMRTVADALSARSA